MNIYEHVIDVFDCFDNVNSVNAMARALRESKGDGKIYQLVEEKFIHVGVNKGSFNVFLS